MCPSCSWRVGLTNVLRFPQVFLYQPAHLRSRVCHGRHVSSWRRNSICFSHADGNRLCLSFLKKQDALGARKDDNRSLFQKLIQMDWVATALAMSATVCIRCVVVISIR